MMIVVVMAVAAGRLLTWSVGGLLDSGAFDPEESPAPKIAASAATSRRWIEVAVVAAALGLWWWEVRCQGLSPMALPAGDAGAVAVSRYAAHAVLGLLLAAAAWIDIRYRVIPDCVTVPGVILGLVVVWLMPDVLLPIGCEVPRSFAPPLLVIHLPSGDTRPPRAPTHPRKKVPIDGAAHVGAAVDGAALDGAAADANGD
jgi:hypothetical protein